MKAKRRKNGRNAGTMSIIFIVLIFVVVMSIQIFKLREKDQLLTDREKNLSEQLSEELQRSEELGDLEKKVNSAEYIKEMAHKLGLVFENEIIFKESSE